MGYIIGVIVLGVIFIALWFIAGLLSRIDLENETIKPEERTGMRNIARGVSFGIIGLILGIVTLTSSIHSVPAGHVGLVYTFGNITGQRDAGFQLTWPWQGFKVASIQGQTLCFMDETDSNKCPEGSRKISRGLDSFSTETQNVYIDVIMNIKVDPENIQDLYRVWGDTYVTKLIPGRVDQIFKDETVKYTAIDLAPSREQIKEDVQILLRQELGQFSIDVVALNIANIQFDQAFEDAILAKQNATQEALRQFALIAAKTNEAAQKAAEAEGNAQKLRIEAQGQADANDLLTRSLTPLLVQYQAIQQLSDNIQIALIPSGQGLILDPSTILRPQGE